MRAPKWAPVALLALLAVVHIWQRSDGGIVSLLQKCCAGTGQPKWTLPGADLDVTEEEGDSADGGEESSGWRWIKQGANLDTPTYYDHPLATVSLPSQTGYGVPSCHCCSTQRLPRGGGVGGRVAESRGVVEGRSGNISGSRL